MDDLFDSFSFLFGGDAVLGVLVIGTFKCALVASAHFEFIQLADMH